MREVGASRLIAYENILRFDIAMHDFLLMHVLDSLHNLSKHAQNIRLCHEVRVLIQELVQGILDVW